MSRSNAAANTTASQALHVRPLIFVQMQFDGGTIYVHNGIGRYTWGGQTWLGLGALGRISEIEETDELSPYRVTFTLNGLDASLVSEVDDGSLYERLVIVYLGYVGDDGALAADPDERWRGFMDTAQISNGAIVVSAETEMARFYRSSGKMFTDEDQQDDYSGDIGFQYLDQFEDMDLRWGPEGQRVDFGNGVTSSPNRYNPVTPGNVNSRYGPNR